MLHMSGAFGWGGKGEGGRALHTSETVALDETF